MTQQERYISHVSQQLLASEEERERFVADLRAHFAEADARQEPAAQTIQKLGNAESVAAAFNAERKLEYAGFLKRLSAFLGDFSLVLIFFLPAALIVALFGDVEQMGVAGAITFGFSILLLLAFSILYFPLLEARFGKTLGKYLMRIRVVGEERGPITLGQAIIRRLSLWLEILWADALFVPFTEKRQRAFDIVARTIVVEEPGNETPFWAWLVCLAGWIPLAIVIAALLAFGTR